MRASAGVEAKSSDDLAAVLPNDADAGFALDDARNRIDVIGGYERPHASADIKNERSILGRPLRV